MNESLMRLIWPKVPEAQFSSVVQLCAQSTVKCSYFRGLKVHATIGSASRFGYFNRLLMSVHSYKIGAGTPIKNK